MKTIDVRTSRSLTRRQALRRLTWTVIGAATLTPVGGDDLIRASARRAPASAERHSERSDRHERHPRQPRLSVRFDSTTSALHIDGERFSENARVDITIDSGSPRLDYSLPWSVVSTTAVGVANNHGRLNHTARLSPSGCFFTGRVEVVDHETGLRATQNFRGAVC